LLQQEVDLLLLLLLLLDGGGAEGGGLLLGQGLGILLPGRSTPPGGTTHQAHCTEEFWLAWHVARKRTNQLRFNVFNGFILEL